MVHKIEMMDQEQKHARRHALLWIYWVFEKRVNPTLNEPNGAARSIDMLSSEFPKLVEAKEIAKTGDMEGALDVVREVMRDEGVSEDDLINYKIPNNNWWLRASPEEKRTKTKPCLNGKEPSRQTTVTIAQMAEEDINPDVLQWLNTKIGDRTPLEWLGECPQRDTPLRLEKFPFSSAGNNITSIKLPNNDRIIGVTHEGLDVFNIVWTGTHAQYNAITGKAPRSRIQEIASRIPRKVMWAPPVFFKKTKVSHHEPSSIKTADAWTEGGGDCFLATINAIVKRHMDGHSGDMLVHGLVWGRGGASGHRFPHAWIENSEDVCIDMSNGKNITMPCQIYHALGGIRKDQAGAYRRYTIEDVGKMIKRYGHAGPWGLDESLQRVPGDRMDDGDVSPTKRQRTKKAQSSQLPKKTMHIMRGVTGYGKSTLCRRMARELGEAGASTVIHCPDDAHMTAPTDEHPDGTYEFKPQILGVIHAENLQNAIRSMERGVDHVFIDATNLLLERMRPYVEAAIENGYQVNFIDMHEQPGVPTHQELMERHRLRGERIPGFDLSDIVGRMEAQYQPFTGKTNEERVQEILDSRNKK